MSGMIGVVIFAGGGGSCQGLRQAGVQLVLGIERDPDAVKVARAVGLSHVQDADVLDLSLFPKMTPGLLQASFPCQPFSSAGKRKGAEDSRNLWPATAAAIDYHTPRWFIGENVRGLTFHRGKAQCRKGASPNPTQCPRCYLDGVIVPDLRRRFAWADYRVLDSADYGTPQHRRRVWIMAGPRPIRWPDPTHSNPAKLTPGTKPWRSMGEALGLQGYTLDQARNTEANPTQERPVPCDDEPCVPISTKGNQYIARGPGDGVLWVAERVRGKSQIRKPTTMDQPSPTLNAAMGSGGRSGVVLRAIEGRGDSVPAYVLATENAGPQPRIEHRLVNRRGREGGAQYESRSVDRPCTALRTPGGGSSVPWIESQWLQPVKGHPDCEPDKPAPSIRSGGSGHSAPPMWLAAPAPTVTAQEVKGTRASPGGDFNGGPDRASDALAMGTGYAVRNGQRTAMGPRPSAKPGQTRPHGRMVAKVFPATGPAPTLTHSPLTLEPTRVTVTGTGDAVRRRLTEPAPTIAAGVGGKGCGQLTADAKARPAFGAEHHAVTGRRRLTVRECRILMNWPECYDEALKLVTKTAAYRILGNGVDPAMSRLLAEAVLRVDKGPKGGFKPCPRCLKTKNIAEGFGFRRCKSKKADGSSLVSLRAQSYCRACRRIKKS